MDFFLEIREFFYFIQYKEVSEGCKSTNCFFLFMFRKDVQKIFKYIFDFRFSLKNLEIILSECLFPSHKCMMLYKLRIHNQFTTKISFLLNFFLTIEKHRFYCIRKNCLHIFETFLRKLTVHENFRLLCNVPPTSKRSKLLTHTFSDQLVNTVFFTVNCYKIAGFEGIKCSSHNFHCKFI